MSNETEELVETPETEEAASQETTEEAADGQVESSETEEAAAESPEEGQPDAEQESEDEQFLAEMRGEDGEIDPVKAAKIAKSYKHAQKLIGQTAKDREALKLAQQKAQTFDQLDILVGKHPSLKAEFERAIQKERGIPVPDPAPVAPKEPETPKLSSEELNKQMSELFRAGKFDAAVALYNQYDPRVQAAQRAADELKQAEARRQAEWHRSQEEAKYAHELQDFRGKYKGTLFSDKGEVLDAELWGGIQAVYSEGKGVTYEEALWLAERKLGRSLGKKPKVDPAKAQAARAPQGAKPKQPQAGKKPQADALNTNLEAYLNSRS